MLMVIFRSGFADQAGELASDRVTVRLIKAQHVNHMLKFIFMICEMTKVFRKLLGPLLLSA